MDNFKVPVGRPQVNNSDNESNHVAEVKKPESVAEIPPQQSQPPPVPQQQTAVCPYREPSWSAIPQTGDEYRFEVLKSGKIIEEIANLQEKPVWKFGRLPENDITMAHPTISRFHAILQYRPPPLTTDDKEAIANQPAAGWYVYDLGSTHGTFLNKQRIPERVYIRIRVGWMLRLGASTRSYILQGPTEDEEPESELTVTELRVQRQEQQNAAISKEANQVAERERQQREEGISWGMSEDADEETDLTHNPYASTNNEELYLDDPKRTLRGYFEREDTPLEYKCDEMSVGSFVCRVELPIYDAHGRPVIAEVVHKGRKKECVVQCALEACRILDRYGVLRQANQEPLKRKLKTQDSDSDDDSFWDRTGDIERKKQRKANAQNSVTLTYEDLLAQETDLSQLMSKVESDIAKCQELQKRIKASNAMDNEEGDDLDNFMENLSDIPQLDKTEIRKLRLEQQRIKSEQQKLQRLIKISKPLDLPSVKAATSGGTDGSDSTHKEPAKKQLPLIGKRNQFSKFKIVKPTIKTTTNTSTKTLASDEEEMEEDSEQQDAKNVMGTILNTTEVTAIDVHQKSEEHKAEQPAINSTQSNEFTQSKEPAITSAEVKTSFSNSVNTEDREPAEGSIESEQVAKKRRQRQRQRYKRQDVEELEEHENSEKYAKWVPPENQSGDGYTQLNDKYGY